MTDGYHKLRLLRMLDRTDAYGWDHSSYLKLTIHQAGKLMNQKQVLFINGSFYRSSLAHIDVESVEIGASRAARSTPMNMPLQPNTSTASRPLVPVLIESGSCSKLIAK